MEQPEDFETTQSSPILKYTVKPGTADLGRQYEFKVTALMCLRGVLGEDDMWISSNADGVGAFDDIVLRRGNSTFMLQLKHKTNPKPIAKEKFLESRGDFSLFQYFPDMAKLKGCIERKPSETDLVSYLGGFEQIYFILFTNRGVKSSELVEQHANEAMDFLNTGRSSDLYKFNAQDLPEALGATADLYLLANQSHENDLDELIRAEVQNIAERFGLVQTNIRDVAVKFAKFVTEWAGGVLGGHYCLTKRDILRFLTDLFLLPYDTKLGQEKYSANTAHIWNEIINEKAVTVVDFDDDDDDSCRFLFEYLGSEVAKYCTQCPDLWNDDVSGDAQTLFYQQHENLKAHVLKIVGNHGQITLVDVYRSLWMDNKLPLLLEISNVAQYDEILNILKMSNYRFKVLIVNKTGENLPAQGLTSFFHTLFDVNEAHRREILRQTVTFQGRRSPTILQNLIDDNMYPRIKSNHIIKILQNKFNIGNQLNTLPDYFIKRTTTRIFLELGLLERNKSELFVIENVQPHHVQLLPAKLKIGFSLDNFDPKCTTIVSPSGVAWGKLQTLHQATKKSIHLVGVHDANHLEWKTSLGSIKHIKKVDLSETGSAITKSYKVNMISAAPGMGKSMFMDHVALSAPTDKWVIRIDLNGHQQYYKSSQCKTANAEQHLQYFQDNSSADQDAISKDVFGKFMQTKDVIVLLDGFDEISPSYREEVAGLARCLYEQGYCIWLTTRPHMTAYLEDRFNTFAVSLTPFTVRDQHEFLSKYFSATLHPGSTSRLKEFVDRLLQAARKNLNDKDAQFMGIPLQTKLIADVFSNDCRNYCINDGVSKFSEHFDLIYLYQTFIDKKIDILQERFGTATQDIHRIIKDHQSLLALKLLFPAHADDVLRLNAELEEYFTDQSDKLQILQREGLITVDENANVNFVHRTFAEYLAAQWLADKFLSEDQNFQSLSRTLINSRFNHNNKFLFSLFDRIVSKNCPLHLAVIEDQMKEAFRIVDSKIRATIATSRRDGPSIITILDKDGRLKSESVTVIKDGKMVALDYGDGRPVRAVAEVDKHGLLQIDPATLIDSGGRSIFHLVSLYGASFPSLFGSPRQRYEAKFFIQEQEYASDEILGLIRLISYDEASNTARLATDALRYNPLAYALANRSLTVADQIRKKLAIVSIDSIRMSMSLKKEYLGYCVLLDYRAMLTQLLSYFAPKDLLLNNVNKTDNVFSYLTSTFDDDDDDSATTSMIKKLLNQYKRSLQLAQDPYYYNYDKTLKTIWELVKHSSPGSFNNFTDIRYAISLGSSKNINKLLSENLNVNQQDADGNAPLHYAVLRRKLKLVALLLEKDAQINKQNFDKDTPLHLMLKHKMPKARLKSPLFHRTKDETSLIIRLLVSRDVDVNLQNAQGNTPLHLVLLEGLDCTNLLDLPGAKLGLKNKRGQTVQGLIKKDNPTVRSSSDEGAFKENPLKPNFINREYKHGKSILHYAAEDGEDKVLNDILREDDADVDKQDNRGNTPLVYALQNNDINMVKLLVRSGANVNIARGNSGRTPLHSETIGKSRLALTELLRSTYANVDQQDAESNTPLFYAVWNNDFETVQLLLSHNANVNVENAIGKTVLHIAAQKGYNDIVCEILPKTSDVNKVDGVGNSPLFYALESNKAYTAQLLVEGGGKLDTENENFVTLLRLAITKGYTAMLAEILKSVDVNQHHIDGKTLLYYAVQNYNLDSVKLLLNRGADVTFQNQDGRTVLHLAVVKGYNTILTELLLRCDELDGQDGYGETALFYALAYGNAEAVELLLENGADPNVPNVNGKTVLHVAAENDYSELLAKMLRYNDVDLDKRDYDGDTPLLCALRNDHINSVDLLMARGANLATVNNLGETALHLAAENGYNRGVNKILRSNKTNVDQQNRDGDTPLIYALRKNEIKTARLLLSYGASVNRGNKQGRTLLHFLAGYGYDSMLSEILVSDENGVKIDVQDAYGYTPLYWALRNNEVGAVNLLLSSGADVNKETTDNGQTVLHLVVQNGYDNLLKRILGLQNVDVDKRDLSGATPLLYALQNDRDDMAGLLIANGADVNVQNENGETALHFAAGRGAMLPELLNCPNVDVDVQNRYGLTPLFHAVHNNQAEAVRLLLSNNAEVQIPDGNGKTVLHAAAEIGANDVLKEFLSKTSRVTKTDTPLFSATWSNEQPGVKLFLSQGVKVDTTTENGATVLRLSVENGRYNQIETTSFVNAPDNDGNTPLFLALSNNHIDTLQLLVENGADVNLENNVGETVLQIANGRTDGKVLAKLLKSGAKASGARSGDVGGQS